jgi:hypothetical protein
MTDAVDRVDLTLPQQRDQDCARRVSRLVSNEPFLESLHVPDCGLECQHETRHLRDVHGRGSVLFFLPRFSFQLNAREFIDHVPKLSRVFFCRLEDAQQRQRKVYLERTHRAVRAEHRHWRALTHGSELLRNPHGYAGAKARAQISQNDFSRPARPPGWGDSGRVWRMRHKFSVASQSQGGAKPPFRLERARAGPREPAERGFGIPGIRTPIGHPAHGRRYRRQFHAGFLCASTQFYKLR